LPASAHSIWIRCIGTELTVPKIRHAFERFLEVLIITIMVSLAALVVVGVVFRKVGAALVWYDEVASILLTWVTYYGACLAALKRTHIGFPKVMQAIRRELRLPLLVVREAAVISFFALAAWAGLRVSAILEGTYLISIPTVSKQLTQSVIPIGAVLFIVAELLSLYGVLGEPNTGGGDERVP
jgi:TRAP-type C4-dicarboxylate transport system permease small subunit